MGFPQGSRRQPDRGYRPSPGSPDAAQRAALLRRGALLIRGPPCER
jgi:hypothetical protein